MSKSVEDRFATAARSHQSRLASDLSTEFDYIVCGSGSTGSVVAERSSADRDEERIMLPPDCKQRRLGSTEVLLERRVKFHVISIVKKEVHLDIHVPGPLNHGCIKRTTDRVYLFRVRNTVRVLSAQTCGTQSLSQCLAVLC